MISRLDQVTSYVQKYDCVSFDLFDTLIYRSGLQLPQVLRNSSAFGAMQIGQLTGQNVSIKQFLNYRHRATAGLKSESNSHGIEPKLEVIFERVFIGRGIGAQNAASLAIKLVQFELDLELSSLKVVEGAYAVLDKLKHQGKSLILISDMYFSEEQIAQILRANSLRNYFDRLFVSSELGSTKRDGGLFSSALKEMALEPRQLVHIGDNLASDVISARKQKIEPVHYRPHNKVEIDDRISYRDRSIYEMVGFLVSAFSMQVALNCAAKNIRRLYFLSRDGTALGESFETLIETYSSVRNLCGELDVRYLSISRSSVMFINLAGDAPSLADVLIYFLGKFEKGYRVSELIKVSGFPDLASTEGELQILNNADCLRIAKTLEALPADMAGRIVNSVLTHRAAAIAYLQQEQVIGREEAIGFVDIGYAGSVGKAVSQFVSGAGKKVGAHESFRLDIMLLCSGNLSTRADLDTYRNIIFSKPLLNASNLSYLQRLNYSWFEIFFQSPKLGPLVQYSNRNNLWQAIFPAAISNNFCVEKWQFEINASIFDQASLEVYFDRSEAENAAVCFARQLASPPKEIVAELSEIDYYCGINDLDSVSIVNSSISLVELVTPSALKSALLNEVWLEGSLSANKISWLKFPLSCLLRVFLGLNVLAKRLAFRS